MARTGIRVEGTRELRRLARELRETADGHERARELRDELVDAMRPVANAARAGARSLPSKGYNTARGRQPLRLMLARSVSISARTRGPRTGVGVYEDARKMPSGYRSLNKFVEGVPGWQRWRHPVWGNQNVWRGQPAMPFFTRSTSTAERRATDAIEKILDQLQRDLE